MDLSQLSEEEKVLVRDCQRKNFWTRALPLSIGAMAGCQVLVARGIIKKSLFKTFGFGLAGYILGRISLPSQIKERLMKEAPNGVLARTARELEQMTTEQRREFLANMRNKGPPIPPQWEGVKGTGPLGSGAGSEPEKPRPKFDDYPRQSQDALDTRLKPSVDTDSDRKGRRDDSGSSYPERFSYAEQRKKYMQTDSGVDFSSQYSKSKSSEELRNIDTAEGSRFRHSDEFKDTGSADSSKYSSQEEFKNIDTPPASGSRKGKKNIYGDEME